MVGLEEVGLQDLLVVDEGAQELLVVDEGVQDLLVEVEEVEDLLGPREEEEVERVEHLCGMMEMILRLLQHIRLKRRNTKRRIDLRY